MTKKTDETAEPINPKPQVANVRLVDEVAIALRAVSAQFDVTTSDVVETLISSLQHGEGLGSAYARAKTEELTRRAAEPTA